MLQCESAWSLALGFLRNPSAGSVFCGAASTSRNELAIASFIIHYLGWQLPTGLIGITCPRCRLFAQVDFLREMHRTAFVDPEVFLSQLDSPGSFRDTVEPAREIRHRTRVLQLHHADHGERWRHCAAAWNGKVDRRAGIAESRHAKRREAEVTAADMTSTVFDMLFGHRESRFALGWASSSCESREIRERGQPSEKS